MPCASCFCIIYLHGQPTNSLLDVQDFVRQGRNFVATPAEAMAATRKLRAERDALRAKLMDLLPRVNNAAQLSSRFKSAQEVLDAIEKHIVSLEDLTGGHNPAVSGAHSGRHSLR